MEPFDRHKQLSVYWFNKASDLRGSAGAIWASIHSPNANSIAEELGLGRGFLFSAACGPVYQMLCGMSLELLLKAIQVEQGKEPPSTHDLVSLWSEVGLARNETVIGLLQILSEAIIWSGRYPVPKKEKHFFRLIGLHRKVLMDEVQLGSLKVYRGNKNLNWESFNQLWKAAYSCYRSQCP